MIFGAHTASSVCFGCLVEIGFLNANRLHMIPFDDAFNLQSSAFGNSQYYFWLKKQNFCDPSVIIWNLNISVCKYSG